MTVRAVARLRRLIPARAGNTTCTLTVSCETPAHPRSRGEHSASGFVISPPSGSSPLARGTHSGSFTGGSPRRLIPARAGNTCPESAQQTDAAAHPRSRGEHFFAGATHAAGDGSSPLARGTPRPANRHRRSHRLIPARAGNTAKGAQRSAADAAHPRSRGEHSACLRNSTSASGSSPLARGTQNAEDQTPQATRLIPARAGNTEA